MQEDLSDREKEILVAISEGAQDKEIAAGLHLSLNTVKWYNRQIYAKLGVTNRVKAVAAAASLGLLEDQTETPLQPISKIPNNLPAQVSSFVGRDREISEIKELLNVNRLVTLTGPGGVGKTRLALEMAEEMLDTELFPDGIYFVELAPLFEPSRLAEVIREELDIKAASDLPAEKAFRLYLKGKTLLLILDNFEHLLDAASWVGELLDDYPDLGILTTSREALRLSGEQIYRLSPLDRQTSTTLFWQRAQEVQSDFNPDEDDIDLICQICQRLDNLPLAIELAAARMNIFHLEELSNRLEDRFKLLSRGPRNVPERHQSLQAAIDWSYDLLDKDEQILFRRLAVFQGSRSIDAVEEVCCFDLDLDVLDGLDSLLSKNLIREKQGLDKEARFFMMETIQEYAKELLQESGESLEIQSRHARYFANLLEGIKYQLLGGSEILYWSSKVNEEFDNFRIILARNSSSGETENGLRIYAALGNAWLWGSRSQEGLKWTEWALEHVESVPISIQAGIYSTAGLVYFGFFDFNKSRSNLEKSLYCCHLLEDERDLGWAHIRMVPLIYQTEGDDHDPTDVIRYTSRGFELLREVGDLPGMAAGWIYLSMHAAITGMHRLCIRADIAAFRIACEIDDPDLKSTSLLRIGAGLLCTNRPRIAESMFKEVIHCLVSLYGSTVRIPDLLDWLAGTALAQGHPDRSVVLQSAADVQRSQIVGCLEDFLAPKFFLEYRKKAAEQLEKSLFQAAWAMGQSMSNEEAIDFALED